MENTNITRKIVATRSRIKHTANLFGYNFPMKFEPFIYSLTRNLTADYKGGSWEFYTLSNGAFYMSPQSDKMFTVSCENGFNGSVTADALGIIVCLYAYSHLSFSEPNKFTQQCANQYHLLREYIFQHAEIDNILQAID